MNRGVRWSVLVGALLLLVGLITHELPECRSPASSRPLPASIQGVPVPFARSESVRLCWPATEPTGRYRVEISGEPSFRRLVLRAVVEGQGLIVPPGALVDGRYYHRTGRDSGAGAWSGWTEPEPMVLDSRFTGLSTISSRFLPLGEMADRVLVRDRRGRLHLILPVMIRGRSSVRYAWSEDDGRSWEVQDLPRLHPECSALGPTLALAPDGGRLHLAWVEVDGSMGDLVHCPVEIHGRPRPASRAERVSRETHPAAADGVPALGVDPAGVVHLAYRSARPEPAGTTWYCRNQTGWGEFTDLCAGIQAGPARSLRIDAAGALHLLWEDGSYRWSSDAGGSWFPPLDVPPQQVFSDLREDGLRARECRLTVRPDRPGAVVVCVADEILPGKARWATGESRSNHNQLWIREIRQGNLGRRVRLHRTPGRVTDPEEIHRIRTPALAWSSDGCLAVAWTERAVGKEGARVRSRLRIGRLDGSWGDPLEIGTDLAGATVSPLPVAGFGDRLDVLWAQSEPDQWLAGALDHPIQHGFFYQRMDLAAEETVSPPSPGGTEGWSDWEELVSLLPEGAGSGVMELAEGGRRIWPPPSGEDPVACKKSVLAVSMEGEGYQ